MIRSTAGLRFGGFLLVLASGPLGAPEAIASGEQASVAVRPGRPTAARDSQNLITRLCIAGFQAAMADAGRVPPPGMETFTCDCFMDEVIGGSGIQAAQNTCRQRAASRYRL